MAKLLTASFLLVFANLIFAQEKMVFSEPLKAMGNSFYEVIYQYNSEDTKTDPEKLKAITSEMVLLIGKEFSQYMELKGLRYDSLCNVYAGKYMSAIESLMLLKRYDAAPARYYLIRNHNNGDSLKVLNTLITMKDPMDLDGFVNYNSVYYDAAPTVHWNITDEKKQIGNVEVTKATGRLRGRDWTAWFAESIPYPEGPWELAGLPGLILEAYDSDNEHEFSLIQAKPVERIIFDRSDKYELTTRERFRKYRKDKFESDYSGWKSGGFPKSAPFMNFIDKE